MADEDSSWMLDDDFAPAAEGGDEVYEDSTATAVEAAPVEVVKPPGQWRTTYKKDVSNLTALSYHDLSNYENKRKIIKYVKNR